MGTSLNGCRLTRTELKSSMTFFHTCQDMDNIANLPISFIRQMNRLPIELVREIHERRVHKVKFAEMDERMLSQIKPEKALNHIG